MEASKPLPVEDGAPTPATRAIEVACRGAHAILAFLVVWVVSRYFCHLDDHMSSEVGVLTAGVAYYEARVEGKLAGIVNKLAPKGAKA